MLRGFGHLHFVMRQECDRQAVEDSILRNRVGLIPGAQEAWELRGKQAGRIT